MLLVLHMRSCDNVPVATTGMTTSQLCTAASVASAAMSYSSGGANLRHGRVPFEAIKRFREKVAAGDPPLGPGVTLTDPRITDALVRI